MIEQNMVSEHDNRADKYIVFSLCGLLFIPALNNFINSIFQNGLSIDFAFLTPLMYIFMAFCSVFFLYKYFFKNGALLLFSMLILLGCLLSYFIYPEIRSNLYDSPVDLVYAPLNKLFYFCIPAMVGIVSISKYDLLLKAIKSWARITVVVGVFTYVFVCLYKGGSLQYMVYSYHMLIPICACFIPYGSKHKFDLIFALMGCVCVLACGARGAVVSLLLFLCILCLSRFSNKMSRRNTIIMITLIGLLLLGIVFFEELVSFTINTFEKNKIDSRFLNSLVDGSLLEGSGREDIADAIIDSIKHNPMGYGFFGDRYATLHFGMEEIHYAHNVFLEILCDFGIIIGPLFLLFFAFRLMKTLYRNRGTELNKIIIILLPYGVFQLFFSSSYLECVPFFMLMGILFFGKNNIIIKKE